MFSPFKSDSERRTSFIYIAISIFLFFLFDYGYQFNILHIEGIEYYSSHTVYAFLYAISDVPVIVTIFWALAKFSRGVAEWFKYIASFVLDCCLIYTIFAFRDPSKESWQIDMIVLLSISVFLVKLLLFFIWKRFRFLNFS